MAAKYSEINLRKSHPTLYRWVMILSLGRVALAFNFWFARPTFQPLGIHKAIAGFVFIALGVIQLVFLHVFRDIRKIRMALAASAGVLIAWGVINCQQVVHHKASFQLPIVFVTIAALQIVTLFEPPRNPISERE